MESEDIDKSKKDESKEEFNFEKLNIDTAFKIIAKRCLIFIGILFFAIFIIALVRSYF